MSLVRWSPLVPKIHRDSNDSQHVKEKKELYALAVFSEINVFFSFRTHNWIKAETRITQWPMFISLKLMLLNN